MYHPTVYKSKLCTRWPHSCSQNCYCPFAHGPSELRGKSTGRIDPVVSQAPFRPMLDDAAALFQVFACDPSAGEVPFDSPGALLIDRISAELPC